MTGSSLLLDTSIVIDFFRGQQDILVMLEQQSTIFVPVAVLGELYLGALRAANTPVKLQQIQAFLNKCSILSANSETARHYAAAKANLLKKGKPIPENDIWIIATALQYNLPLFTTDKHFKEVEGIALV